MGETKKTEWQYASWVSTLGKWAWVILILQAIISIMVELFWLSTTLAAWEASRPYYVLLGLPMPPMPIGGFIWSLIGAIILLAVSFIIIKPKFSKPCGDKDWDSLYDWTLALGNFRIPWMLIWGIVLELFSWYYVAGLVVLLPAIMLLFAGPKEYNWSSEEKKAEK